MQGTIYITGVIGEDTTLIDVVKQVKAQKNAESYLVRIDSVGGLVSEGESIYQYLKNLEKPVTTYAIQAYSIASVIFMAGSVRIVSEASEKPLMIHLPWMEVAGSHDEITAHLSDLKAVENKLVTFYSEALEIDKNTIQSLLQNETYLSAKQAIELGFATTLQAAQKAVAKLSNNENEKEETLMNKLERKLNQILMMMGAIKAELILQDATAVEIVFPDLVEGDIPAQGDKATVDGKPADGEYPMPDGQVMVFTSGALTEVKPTEEAPSDEEAENAEGDDAPTEEDTPAEDKDARIAELEAENAELKARIGELEGESSDAEAKESENEKLLEVLEISAQKVVDLEAKYNALAKSIGSDFQVETKKENNPAIQAKEGEKPKFSIKRK